MSKIGVEASTTIRSGPINQGPVSGRFQIPAITSSGPVDRAVLIRSIAEYESMFGPRAAFSANGYDTARMFFEEGGSELIVSRVVGPAAVNDKLTLMDSSAAETLLVEARNPGGHTTPIKASVSTTGAQCTITISQGGETLAIFNGGSPADLVAAASKSPVVRISDLGSATAAPGNLPITAAATDLIGGTDDRASITVDHVIAALGRAGELGEGGAVAAPGYPASIIGTALIDYAKANARVALLAPAVTETADSVIAAAPDLIGGAGDHAGLFFPHLTIPDGSATRVISPEGYVAAMRTRAHQTAGYWRKPFGDIAQCRWVVGTVVPVNTELNNRLSDAQVNGIVTTGTKVRLYNWVSLSNNSEMRALSARDVLNNLSREVKNVLEPFVGETVDDNGHLTARIGAEVEGLLSPIADAGGFFGLSRDTGDGEQEEIDPGYQITVDSTNNPLSSLEQNVLNVTVLVRLSPTADLIRVEIIKVPLQSAF